MVIVSSCSDVEESNTGDIDKTDDQSLIGDRPLTYTVFESGNLGSNGEVLESVEVTIFNEYDDFLSFYQKLLGNKRGIKENLRAIQRLIKDDGVDEASLEWMKKGYENALERRANLDFIELDFISGSVLFIDLGMKLSTGYEIQIRSIRNHRSITYLNLNELSPGEDCIVGAAITRPHVFAYVHKKLEAIEIQVNKYNAEC